MKILLLFKLLQYLGYILGFVSLFVRFSWWTAGLMVALYFTVGSTAAAAQMARTEPRWKYEIHALLITALIILIALYWKSLSMMIR